MRKTCALALTVLLLFLLSIPAAGTERALIVKHRPPLAWIQIGDLTDVKGRGKTFTGPGVVGLKDGTEIAVSITRKYNAKKNTSTYKILSAKGTLPQVKCALRTVGDPEKVIRLSFQMKGADKTKSSIKEDDETPDVVLDDVDPDLSDDLTLQGVRALLSGDDDFAAMVDKFEAAIEADPRNPNAAVFLAMTGFLEYAKSTLAVDGTARDLYTGFGAVDEGDGSFWDFDPVETEHNEGDIKDDVPGTGEVRTFAREDVLPEVQKLLSALEETPDSFEYRITFLDAGGPLVDGDLLDDVETVWLDAGDVHLLRSILLAVLAFADFLDAYEDDDLDIGLLDIVDDPDRDFTALFEDTYTEFGTLVRPERLATARAFVEEAFEAYVSGARHILGETTAQRESGLVTPYRTAFRGRLTFDDDAERDVFISEEEAFREWAEDLIAAFDDPEPYAITGSPFGGELPADERVTIGFEAFWGGLDLRDLWFRTVSDPLTGKRAVGVTSLSELTTDMFTAGGAVELLRGVSPVAGDIAHPYTLLVETVPDDGKTVDGDLDEWNPGTNAETVMKSVRALHRAPRADFGEAWLSRDEDHLFLALTMDPDDRADLSVVVEGDAGWVWVGSGYGDGSSEAPVVQIGEDGLEAAIPISNFPVETWVTLEIDQVGVEGRKMESQRILVRIR